MHARGLNKVDGRCVGARPESSMGFNLISLDLLLVEYRPNCLGEKNTSARGNSVHIAQR